VALTTPEEMAKIVRKLRKADPAFIPVIKNSPLCTIASKKYNRGHYETLINSIISQQLAIKAADTIINRVRVLADGALVPENIVDLSATDLRTAGVSGAKARAIAELTEATISGTLNFKKFPKMTNAEISEALTSIWGIGRWTVEMFLIFHLGRLDIWPVGDLAVRRGWEKLHKLPEQISQKDLDLLGANFAGYQSVVAWYCWRATDGDSSTW